MAPAPPTEARAASLWVGAVVFMLLAALVLFGLFEGALRIWWPQTERVDGGARAIRDPDPEVEYVYRPGAHVVIRTPEYVEDCRINSDGLRDEAVHVNPKPPGVFRMLVVGDSFTFGTGSNYGDIWPVILERRLAAGGWNVDVVKAGVEGSDTRRELLIMRKQVPRYRPDLVVLAFLPNDLFTNQPLGRAGAAGGESGERSHRFALESINLLQRLLFQNDGLYARLYMMTARRQYFAEPPDALVAEQYRVTIDLLRQSAEYAGLAGTKFAVLSIPQSFQVLFQARGMRAPGIDVDAVDRRLGAFAAADRVPWLPVMDRMVEDYRSNRSDLFYRFDGHLTARGNHVVGEWLASELLRLHGGDAR